MFPKFSLAHYVRSRFFIFRSIFHILSYLSYVVSTMTFKFSPQLLVYFNESVNFQLSNSMTYIRIYVRWKATTSELAR